jgi:lipid A 3-O-deacylase
MTRAFLLTSSICFILALYSPSSSGQDHPDSVRVSYFSLGPGIYNCLGKRDLSPELNINYFSKIRWWVFSPFAGGVFTTNASYMIYAGVFVPVDITRILLFRISFAPGIYNQGQEIYLGLWLEFRTSVEFSVNILDKVRLGLEFSHISNASISPVNPGCETINLMVQIPVRFKQP